MHFNAFVIGRDIVVDKVLIKQILNDHETMERERFELSYYKFFVKA